MTAADDSPAGILLSVHMINFLKHDNLLIDLKPHVNFITGRNGSGKSSILVALAVGLGSNSKTSGRGNNMVGLIKDGRNEATIIITIKNIPSGYKMEQYGDKIVVTRKLRRTGTQSYEISNFPKGGNAHDELVRILQFYNIQIDNPCSIMHQDTAREFIGSSSPQRKYDLFMRGTLLTALKNDMNKITTNINLVEQKKDERLLEQKEVNDVFSKVQEQYETVEEAQDIKNRINDLENELVWSYYRISATKRDKIEADLQNAQNRLEEANQALEVKRKAAEEAKRNKEESEKRVSNALKEVQKIKAEKDKVAKQLDTIKINRSNKKRELVRLTNQISRSQSELTKKNKEKSDLERKKEDHDNNNERNRKIAELEEKETEAQRELNNVEGELNEIIERYRGTEPILQNIKIDLHDKEAEYKSISEKLTSIQNVYSTNTQTNSLTNQIRNQSHRFSFPPIGPLSLYITLKDQSWGIAVQQIIGNLLDCFIVNSHEDELELRKMAGKQPSFSIIIGDYTRPRFNYNTNTPKGCQLMIDIINIKSEEITGRSKRSQATITANTRDIITNFLIDIKVVDRILCTEDETLARKIAFSQNHQYMTIVKSGVQYKYQNGYEVRSGAQSKQCRIGIDETQRIAQLEAKKNNAAQERDEIKKRFSEANKEMARLKDSRKQLERRRQECKDNLIRIQKKLRSVPDEASDFDTKLNVIIESIQSIEESIANDQNKLPELEKEIDKLKNDKSSLLEQINSFSGELFKADDFKKESDKYYNLERNAQIELDKAQRVKNQIDGQIAKLNEDSIKTKEEAATTLVKARQHSPQCEQQYQNTARPTEQLIDFLKSERKKYENAQKLSGLDFEEITLQYNKVFNEVKKAQIFIEELNEFISKANQALQERQKKLDSIFHSIKRRTKMSFYNYQRKRQYAGKLHFRHDEQIIDMAVRSKADTEFTDVANLSGGEKSYCLVSLLLSLWEVMECPFYCVDEFDVFMDDINRQAATNLLIQGASVMENRQFIFITPLSLDHLANNEIFKKKNNSAIFEIEKTDT